MELTISGIKCDTTHCNYRDDDVKFSDYPQWLKTYVYKFTYL